MTQNITYTKDDLIPYSAGHPWFYVLGGKVRTLKDIREVVRQRGYKGYREEDIRKADAKQEPARSHALRIIKYASIDSLDRNISDYRRAARELHALRRHEGSAVSEKCHDAHSAVSLKHNHIYNDFAHLIWIDELLSQQADLFDF